MKKLGKKIIVKILQAQVKRLLARNSKTKLIGVAGSIGKTSTKLAIAGMLQQKYRVQFQEGNYNDSVTVPLILFGHNNPPALINPFAWLRIFLANERIITRHYPYDVVVLELGTDGPGQVAAFGDYLKLSIAVITAVSFEHMEYFDDLDAVAEEEFSIQNFCDKLIINQDLIQNYKNHTKTALTYGLKEGDYHFNHLKKHPTSYDFAVQRADRVLIEATYQGRAHTELYSLLAAVTVGYELGLSPEQLMGGIATLSPAAGRMKCLKGISGSTILDDSYNASPEAVRLALETLIQHNGSQKIALLGSMNELGSYSEPAHKSLGRLCHPKQLDLVVTLGSDANTFLAPEAVANGCIVKQASSPYAAGQIIKAYIKKDAVVLVKGSQNGVFAEEAIKSFIENKADTSKLVRQSQEWLAEKKRQFEDYNG